MGYFAATLFLRQEDGRPRIIDIQDFWSPLAKSAVMLKINQDTMAVIEKLPEQSLTNANPADTLEKIPLMRFYAAVSSGDIVALKSAFSELPDNLSSQPFYLAFLVCTLQPRKDPDLGLYYSRLAAAVDADSDYALLLGDYYFDKGDWASYHKVIGDCEPSLMMIPDALFPDLGEAKNTGMTSASSGTPWKSSGAIRTCGRHTFP